LKKNKNDNSSRITSLASTYLVSMIKMEALKSALEAIGFHNVQTYIQSGNVL
jgi:uncharacterized protein (DUF1697 family)